MLEMENPKTKDVMQVDDPWGHHPRSPKRKPRVGDRIKIILLIAWGLFLLSVIVVIWRTV